MLGGGFGAAAMGFRRARNSSPFGSLVGGTGSGQIRRIAAVLRQIKGRFLSSLNDTPDVRGHYAWASIERVETAYTVGGGSEVKRSGELIIATPADDEAAVRRQRR